jgi:hypothetical protein
VQVGALFHDVERLASEAEARVEHEAPDYVRFKRAHAEAGGRAVAAILERLQAPRALVERTRVLVAHHEGRHPDEPIESDAALIADADVLSFFSLNAPGFARHYGAEHTARKVAYGLRRLGAPARPWLARLKLTAPIRDLIAGWVFPAARADERAGAELHP